jgi:hypothetical protein
MGSSCVAKSLCVVSFLVLMAPLFVGDVSSAPDKANRGKADSVVYNLYFGDLHSHTALSDGTGDPYDAYQMGMDGGADFMALTEHVQFWNAYDAWIMDADEWEYLKEAADYFNEDGSYVAIAGYETWMLANCGEVNVYNVPELPPANNLGYRFDRLPNFYDWLAEQPGAIGQFNHPLYVSEDFMDYAYYTETRDMGMAIIEAYNWEYYDPSYVKALDAGWHLMPSANSDTHYTDWIVSYEVRTVLLAEELTRGALYDAMRSCRGYATLDRNLRVEFALDGAVMGSNLMNPDGSYEAVIAISDPDGVNPDYGPSDAITLVEIVTDGGAVVASMPGGDSSISWTVTLDSIDARYFFVRVTTASPLNEDAPGVTAWTAPVWTGR